MHAVWTVAGLMALALLMTPRFMPTSSSINEPQYVPVPVPVPVMRPMETTIKVRKPAATKAVKLVQTCRTGGHVKCHRLSL
jgi:hypothetical protein